jgi:hypothetical protein
MRLQTQSRRVSRSLRDARGFKLGINGLFPGNPPRSARTSLLVAVILVCTPRWITMKDCYSVDERLAILSLVEHVVGHGEPR